MDSRQIDAADDEYAKMCFENIKILMNINRCIGVEKEWNEKQLSILSSNIQLMKMLKDQMDHYC